MDCYFTGAEVLNHVHAKTDRFGRPRGYVGDLKTNRNLEWKGRIVKASDLAASIPPEDRKELRQRRPTAAVFHGDGADSRRQTQGADRDPVAVSPRPRTDQNPGDQSDHLGGDAESCRSTGIAGRVRRPFIGTASSNSGVGDCQLRDPHGQTRHMYLVMLAYSLLMSELKQGRAKEWCLLADDHRRSLSGDAQRDPADDALLGDRTNHQMGANPMNML